MGGTAFSAGKSGRAIADIARTLFSSTFLPHWLRLISNTLHTSVFDELLIELALGSYSINSSKPSEIFYPDRFPPKPVKPH